MRAIAAAALAIATLSTPALANEAAKSETCAAVTEAEIGKLFDRWNASLATLKPEEVAKNYAEDAVLLPTLANEPHISTADRIKYFTEFLKKTPQGTIDKRVVKIGCNTAIDTGIYTFKLKDGSKVPARYTFTYALKNGQWLITSHHSSMMPEEMTKG